MPKPKQFHYQPRYYDERKERLEKIKARADAENATKKDGGSYTGLQRGFLSERRTKSKFHLKHKKASALRFFIILIAILGVLYVAAPDLFLAFWKFK